MDPRPKPKPLIAAWAIAILVGVIVLAKPWLVEHLGIGRLSIQDRLLWMSLAVVVCTICVVIVRVLNRSKPNV
jgi:hypothetical protein